MKHLLLIFTVLFSIVASAQTPIIAHKSHAGSKTSFLLSTSSNFGKIAPRNEPRFQLKPIEEPRVVFNESFQPVNDTTVVKLTTTDNNQLIRIDTISKKKTETIEEVKKMHSTLPKESWNKSQAEGDKKKNEVIMFTPPGNGNPPSFPLVMLVVSIAGLIVYRLFFGRMAVQNV